MDSPTKGARPPLLLKILAKILSLVDKLGKTHSIFGNGKKQKIMFRSGKSRFSGELIDETQQDAIDRFALSELQRLGSDFPYVELFM